MPGATGWRVEALHTSGVTIGTLRAKAAMADPDDHLGNQPLTREQLYDKVWTAPFAQVAKVLDVSERALAKPVRVTGYHDLRELLDSLHSGKRTGASSIAPS